MENESPKPWRDRLRRLCKVAGQMIYGATVYDWVRELQKERGMIERSVADLVHGRGDATVAGVRCTGAGITGFAYGTVADEDRMRRGIDGLAAFRKHGSIVSRLKKASLRLDASKRRLPDVPADVQRWRLTPAGSAAGAPPDAGAYRLVTA